MLDQEPVSSKSAGDPAAKRARKEKKDKKEKEEKKVEDGEKKPEAAAAATAADEAKASTDAAPEAAKTAESAAEADKKPDAEAKPESAEGAAAAEAKASESESEEEASESEEEASESEEESESDSDSASGSGGSSSSDEKSAEPAPEAKPDAAPAAATAPAAAKASAPPPADTPAGGGEKGEAKWLTYLEKESKRLEFVCKLRMQLVSVKDMKQRALKLQQVQNMLKEHGAYLQQVAGMTQTDISALMDELDRSFAAKQPAKAKPKPPPGPPPKALAARKDGDAGNGAKPVQKSALKGANGQRTQRRCSWVPTAVKTVAVESYRAIGETLWFQMPGAYVSCDSCENQVPQSMGALQGEPERPQFAQFQFFCHECMQRRGSRCTL